MSITIVAFGRVVTFSLTGGRLYGEPLGFDGEPLPDEVEPLLVDKEAVPDLDECGAWVVDVGDL